MNLVCPSEKNENDTKLQKLVIRLNNKSAAIQNIIQGMFYNPKITHKGFQHNSYSFNIPSITITIA